MVRMVMEVRPDPRLYDEAIVDCKSMRGRSGHQLHAGRPSRRPSRARRSPTQQFVSRVYWREVTQAELRQHQRGLHEALSLAAAQSLTTGEQPIAAEGSCSSLAAESSQKRPHAGDATPAMPAGRLLHAFVDRALESHAQQKLDQRIASEWEVVEDVDAEEYVLL